jgi:dihydroorotate dehydrogenase (fumarate)
MHTDLEAWVSKYNYLSTDQFKGKLSQKNLKNPAEFEGVQFMKYFSDREVE